jgi:hypothetical protein
MRLPTIARISASANGCIGRTVRSRRLIGPEFISGTNDQTESADPMSGRLIPLGRRPLLVVENCEDGFEMEPEFIG